MKLNRQQLEKIKETIDFLLNKYHWFADYADDYELKAEDIDEFVDSDYEIPDFYFPGEEDKPEITTEAFLKIADEIPHIKITDNSIIKTKLLRYFIVETTDTYQDQIIRYTHNLKLNLPNDIEINLVKDNFIIGLAAIELDEYDRDYWGTVSPYLAVELKYNSGDKILTAEQELDIVKSFIFEIADSTGIALRFSEIRNPVNDYEDLEEEAAGQAKLRELEVYNEGMRLFVSAIQIQEEELKFLNFYKILEHFAPIAVNIEANELMRKKLDAPKVLFEDGDYIRSIFELAKAMREKFNDEDLIKSTFSTCFDFLGIFELLPDSIKTKVKKHLGEKTINYSIDKQKITTAANMVGKIIYATRNKVVHAKSNYETSGNECDGADIATLNLFMKEACSQTIRWYNRQPNHFKLTII